LRRPIGIVQRLELDDFAVPVIAATPFRANNSAVLPHRSRKIEFSFVNGNLVVPAGPPPTSIVDDRPTKEI
jgi:hypothetical protein